MQENKSGCFFLNTVYNIYNICIYCVRIKIGPRTSSYRPSLALANLNENFKQYAEFTHRKIVCVFVKCFLLAAI